MDPSDVHANPLGEAVSQSGQRLAQLASLLTSWAMVEARRIERRNAAKAAHSEQELHKLREQERAARELARAGWAPAEDQRWLAGAGLVHVARAWSAAAAYADVDPGAATALARCESRLRQLHPYAMSWYDRQRAQGAGLFDAMKDALPLFARPAHVRPGGPAPGRPGLGTGISDQPTATGSTLHWDNPQAASSPPIRHDASPLAARSAANLAAEGFPWTIADTVGMAGSDPQLAAAHPRATMRQPAERRNLSP